jgi:hypothetical protein
MPQEPQYFDCDEDGNSGEDRKSAVKIPKWRQTTTQFQIDFLATFGLLLFPLKDKDIKKDLIEIERGMAPIASLPNLNKELQDDRLVHPYPKEWVDFALKWAISKRNEGNPISVRAIINYIRNKEKMIAWLESKKLFVFILEKKYETRPEVRDREAYIAANKNLVEVKKDASLEAKYADFPD